MGWEGDQGGQEQKDCSFLRHVRPWRMTLGLFAAARLSWTLEAPDALCNCIFGKRWSKFGIERLLVSKR